MPAGACPISKALLTRASDGSLGYQSTHGGIDGIATSLLLIADQQELVAFLG